MVQRRARVFPAENKSFLICELLLLEYIYDRSGIVSLRWKNSFLESLRLMRW